MRRGVHPLGPSGLLGNALLPTARPHAPSNCHCARVKLARTLAEASHIAWLPWRSALVRAERTRDYLRQSQEICQQNVSLFRKYRFRMEL